VYESHDLHVSVDRHMRLVLDAPSSIIPTGRLAVSATPRPTKAGIEPSVGSVGDSYDYALAETINGPLLARSHSLMRTMALFEAVEFAT
jgi:transposase InsO family protein